jgi:multidrug efflux pump subunit AcrA (membrane-fusion protein)
MKSFASFSRSRAVTAALVSGLGVVLAAGWVTRADEPATPNAGANATPGVVVSGITSPSIERKLRFAAPGIVAEVTVKEGDVVKAHQVLAKQDSRQDQQQYLSDKREADSNEKIDYSKADLKSKQVDLKRKQDLFAEHAASLTEVETADLAVKLAEAQVNLAIMEHDQKGFDAERERIKIEQMTMFSPIDGVIEDLNVGEGEMGDPQARDGAIIVGQWNPLWLEMHLPSSQAAKLKLNQELQVKYDAGKWQTAKIILFKKVDPASDTQLVRLELANPDNMEPGLHMQVQLPAEIPAVAAGR